MLTLEITRRRLLWSGVKLAFGALMAITMVAIALEPPPPPSANDVVRMIALIAAAGSSLLLVASNAWLIIRRPPVLRATSEGVWFGAGPTIPWRDVALVYEAGMYFNRYGHSGRTHAIAFAFHRARTMLKLPPFLWLTTLPLGDVRISVETADVPPNVLAAQLDQRRASLGIAPSAR